MRNESQQKRMQQARAGFTLLEVLAAVAILGIWFTVLATVAIQGLRAEGANTRLIRASLAADTLILELEDQIQNGEFPLDDLETEVEDFQVLITAVPLNEAAFGEPELDLAAYLGETLGAVNDNLYEMRVELTWIEGVDERTLVRSTYAWDPTEYRNALSAATGGGAASDEDDPDALDQGAGADR